jgi:predicted esterase
MLHGEGSTPRSGLRNLRKVVGDARVVLLAPPSRGRTWDVVLGGYGPDVAALDGLLRRVSAALPVDRSRLAIAGHSDGASYALSLGLTNGDLFTHVIAFSPGFAAPAARRGKPSIYESHGRRDKILPIDRTSRRLVTALRAAGYRVRYREFAGGHGVPSTVAREALAWFLGG